MRFIQTVLFASLFGVLALVPVAATKAADPVKNERGEERRFKKDWRHEGVESKDENWLKEFARQQAEGQSKDDLNKGTTPRRWSRWARSTCSTTST